MWQVLDMFFTSKSKMGFSFKENLGVSHILKDREQAEKYVENIILWQKKSVILIVNELHFYYFCIHIIS